MKNKKILLFISFISIILICSILLPCLSACKKDDGGGDNNPANNQETEAVYTSRELADAIIAAYSPEDFPDVGLDNFFSGADENGENYIDPERIGIMFNNSPFPISEFDYLEDYAFYFPAGQSMFEVDVLRVKKEEINNAETLKNIIAKRLTRVTRGELLNYAPQELPIYENAKLAFALLDSTNKVIALIEAGGTDISAWRPGKTIYENAKIYIPPSVKGEYKLALGIFGENVSGNPKYNIAIEGRIADNFRWYVLCNVLISDLAKGMCEPVNKPTVIFDNALATDTVWAKKPVNPPDFL